MQVLSALALSLFVVSAAPQQGGDAPPQPYRVIGQVVPAQVVHVPAPGGLRLERCAELGQKVERGDQVAEFDSRELELELQAARLAHEELRLRFELAQRRLQHAEGAAAEAKERYEKLRESGVRTAAELQQDLHGAELELEEARVDRRVLELELRRQELEVERAELRLERTRCKAPIGGIVTELRYAVGEVIEGEPGQFAAEPVLVIAAVEECRVEIEVPGELWPKLRPGLQAEATLGELRFHGVVDRIAPVVDGATGLLGVRLRLETGEHTLPPGLRVPVQLQLP